MAINPDKITDNNPFGGGAPTLEERAEKVHWDAAKRIQTSMGKGTKKAEDILRWRLEQIHKSMDPKNKRKTEEVWVKNPKFDQSKPDSKDNPFYIKQTEGVYDPDRFKENTITSTVTQYMTNHKEEIKRLREAEKELKALHQEKRDADDFKESASDQDLENTSFLSLTVETDPDQLS